MRNSTLLLALSASLHGGAQSFPFPTSNATWVQYFEVMITMPPLPQFVTTSTANFCVDGSDTLIAGTSYTRLLHCDADYVGGIREEDAAVYFFPADSTQEYLLYDFGAAVGDTLYDVYVNELLATGSAGWMGTRLVDVVVTGSAPHPDYGGRIAMQLQTLDPDLGTDSEWIEGMGCIHGLFTLNPINISEYWYGLDCFSHNDTTYWNGWYTEAAGNCVPQFVGVEELHPARVDLFPNPTTDRIQVRGKALSMDLLLIDLAGRVHRPKVLVRREDIIELDLGTLPAGVYQLMAWAGNSLGRVVKQ